MSFGLERERIGDIIVYENLAYIIVLKQNSEYIKAVSSLGFFPCDTAFLFGIIFI